MGRISKGGDFEVEQFSIDDLVKKKRVPPPNYMKIDIEGAEYLALRGTENTLREHHPLYSLRLMAKTYIESVVNS